MRWLHLSDFHFQADERWDRRATLNALLRHVEKLRDQEDLRPDFVFVTGDVAFSGKKKEYEQAERFFVKLAETLELEPRESFFFVPGNHDVDRGAIGPGDPFILQGLQDQDAVERILGDAGTMVLLGRRLENFYAFTERLLEPARGWRGGRPWRVDMRQADGVDVGILQLNSAWASGSEDNKDLLVGEAQVRKALVESADAFLRIVLVHHPLVELREFDREKLEPLYAASRVPFVLRGHLHSNQVREVRIPDGVSVELAAGTIYTGGSWPRSYLLTEADLGEGRARVHFMSYADKGKGFWNRDGLLYENAPAGIWELALPEQLKSEAGDTPPAPAELTDARRSTLADRYRTTAAAVHGTVRFVGFADHRPRPNVQVPELFVPLRLTRRNSDADETTADLVRGLLAPPKPGASAPRVVVLGDPGSGKTTLCRFVAVVLAGEAGCDGVDVPEVLPLFLPFRGYVRLCEKEDRSLLEFLDEQARTQLQLKLPKTFLEEALEKGRAVLLLDGLDEVGSAADREEARDRVQAFCRLYQKVPVLLTSRVAGYEDAPLSEFTFQHLMLAPFNDADLRRFVSLWYDIQEANDPVERDRGVTDLITAIEADERVRELARNPMLATLIALVHRFEAHLPGERAKLYEICVKTLLETWPAARRRTFKEIDTGLQRAYLQALAFYMQSSRSSGDGEVVISRMALIRELVKIVRDRSGTSTALEETRSLIERWVQYLEEGTGLLVEQRPGIFAFFHLSLMEYAAAQGMDSAEDLEDAVVRRFADATWREVCLLAVGSHATEKPFLNRIFKKVSKQTGGWPFLLRCLREEAAFDEHQLTEIVRGAGKRLLDIHPDYWQEDQSTLDDVMRFSLRNAMWARTWVRKEICTSTGEGLRAIIAFRKSDARLIETLQKRSDSALAAADLLEFWPEPRIGDWAATFADTKCIFEWGKKSPVDVLTARALRSLAEFEYLAPGFLVGLLEHVTRLAEMAQTCSIRSIDGDGSIERDIPTCVEVEPGLGRLPIPVVATRFFSSKGSLNFDHCFARRSAHGFAQDFVRGFARYFILDFALEFTQDFAKDSAIDFSLDFARYFARDLAKDFARNFTDKVAYFFGLDFKEKYNLNFCFDKKVNSLAVPVSDMIAADVDIWRDATDISNIEVFSQLTLPAFARLATEAWIAMATTMETSLQERLAYVYQRVQNAWLLLSWPAVDRALQEPPHTNQLALYLTLGFTQATTTWQWPATERWIALLCGEPPEHWLPRSQWHLCWLLYDPEDADHRRGVDEALDEGLGDEERLGVAEELKKLIA